MNEPRYICLGRHLKETNILDNGRPMTCGEVVDELNQLRAALQPFANLGAKIPENWPDSGPMRVDTSQSTILSTGIKGEYLSFQSEALLPTIGQWHEASNAINEREIK